ncbi:SGNH/GDSL hydrolase family protein [Bacteroides xylanisolvens]|uniref:SGNH/GDSL hydrolase family protein n=1 Tax=Bacteroides xylanisolvens TaxID=371601 RepID=UPI001BA45A98|nr:SGNH/GDSL hydrolase family protein [Bacteroides xylanisolvens]QUR46167.1 SGNH/GDSL hydrolase family protein [Bacteroides xylanisolvens]
MDKLTKEFKSGEVLKAQDLNSIKDKVNELVEGVNTGSGTTITVDSSLSTTSTNPVQNKVITEELNKKVLKVDGKGLSTNDFDNEYKLKIDNMSSGGVASTTEKGFFVCDSNGNIAFQYDSNGFDAAKLSIHFKSLLQINIGSKWNGKTINVLGDSNTAFGKFTNPLSKLLECTLNNYGVAGTRIASSSASDTDSFCARYPDMAVCDAVLVMGGTNDWNQAWSEGFGTFSDRQKNTFCGALHYLFSGLIEKYPDIPIVICTIPHNKNEEYAHMTPSQYISDNGEGITLNHNSKTLDDYSDMIIRVARWYGLPVIDVRHAFVSGVITRYFSDDVHFNDLGGSMIARCIAVEMENIYDKFYKKIQ